MVMLPGRARRTGTKLRRYLSRQGATGVNAVRKWTVQDSLAKGDLLAKDDLAKT